MSDPITTIITAVIEHAPGAGAVVAAYKAAKPFLEKILGPSADELGEMGRDYVKGKRVQNAARTVADAATLLDATGREAQAVPLKVLEPLLSAASLEEEPNLAAKWAALLANAADPAQTAEVKTVYAEILKQLTSADAKLLDRLFRKASAQHYAAADTPHEKAYHQKTSLTGTMLDLGHIHYESMDERGEWNTSINALMEGQKFDAMIDGFLRQQILILAKGQPLQEKAFARDYKPDRKHVFFTSLGYDFMVAITAPQV